MVVKVIDTQPHKSVVSEKICRNCGVTLQYVPADVAEEIHRDYGGGSDTYRYIVCPACSSRQGVGSGF